MSFLPVTSKRGVMFLIGEKFEEHHINPRFDIRLAIRWWFFFKFHLNSPPAARVIVQAGTY